MPQGGKCYTGAVRGAHWNKLYFRHSCGLVANRRVRCIFLRCLMCALRSHKACVRSSQRRRSGAGRTATQSNPVSSLQCVKATYLWHTGWRRALAALQLLNRHQWTTTSNVVVRMMTKHAIPNNPPGFNDPVKENL